MSTVKIKNTGWPTAIKPCRGYTLVELLLAIFIFALVVASVYGASRATFTIIYGSEQQALLADRGGFIISRVTEDLQSLILGKAAFLLGEDQSYAGGQKDSLSFLADAQVFLGKNDVPRGRLLITYSAEVDERSGLLSLYRAETAVFPGIKIGEGGVTQKYLLCSGLQEIRFTYRDTVGNVVTKWESGGNDKGEKAEAPTLPVVVGVELVFPGIAPGKKMQVFRMSVVLPPQVDSQGAAHGKI